MLPEAQSILKEWSPPVLINVVIVPTALCYLRGWLSLRRTSPELIPPWRLAAFLTGMFSLWIAIGSPLSAFDEASLTVHMIQHILLMLVVPPLVLFGAPSLPFLHGLPQGFVRTLGLFLRWPPVQSLGKFLTHPSSAGFSPPSLSSLGTFPPFSNSPSAPTPGTIWNTSSSSPRPSSFGGPLSSRFPLNLVGHAGPSPSISSSAPSPAEPSARSSSSVIASYIPPTSKRRLSSASLPLWIKSLPAHSCGSSASLSFSSPASSSRSISSLRWTRVIKATTVSSHTESKRNHVIPRRPRLPRDGNTTYVRGSRSGAGSDVGLWITLKPH